MFSIPFAAKSSSIKSTSSRVLFMQVRCAMASIPYFFFICDAISQVERFARFPPAPYVTLIYAGFIAASPSMASYTVSMGKFLLGGKTSSENTVLPGVYKSLIFIFLFLYVTRCLLRMFILPYCRWVYLYQGIRPVLFLLRHRQEAYRCFLHRRALRGQDLQRI